MGEIKSGEALASALAFAGRSGAPGGGTRSIGIISGMHDNLVPMDLRPNYARLVDKAFGARAREFGWKAKPGEDAETRLLRSAVVPLVALWGADGSLAADARQLAVEWFSGP